MDYLEKIKKYFTIVPASELIFLEKYFEKIEYPSDTPLSFIRLCEFFKNSFINEFLDELSNFNKYIEVRHEKIGRSVPLFSRTKKDQCEYFCLNQEDSDLLSSCKMVDWYDLLSKKDHLGFIDFLCSDFVDNFICQNHYLYQQVGVEQLKEKITSKLKGDKGDRTSPYYRYNKLKKANTKPSLYEIVETELTSGFDPNSEYLVRAVESELENILRHEDIALAVLIWALHSEKNTEEIEKFFPIKFDIKDAEKIKKRKFLNFLIEKKKVSEAVFSLKYSSLKSHPDFLENTKNGSDLSKQFIGCHPSGTPVYCRRGKLVFDLYFINDSEEFPLLKIVSSLKELEYEVQYLFGKQVVIDVRGDFYEKVCKDLLNLD